MTEASVRDLPPEPNRAKASGSNDGTAGIQAPRLSGRNNYSLFVGFMKVVLPALAVALIILVIAWPQIAPDERQFTVGIADISPQQAENLSMLNARFTGVDRQNQPFNVTADMATQKQADDDMIELQMPKADITLDNGDWLSLEARLGHYERSTEILDLEGAVQLFRDDGLELHTESARVELNGNNAEGFEPIKGQGPFGTLSGEGFRVENGGANVTVTGRSRLLIYPEGQKFIGGDSR